MATIDNPVLRGMYPDPSWMWDGANGRIALVNSTFEYVPGLPIHASDDMAHFTLVGHAVDEAMAHALLLDYVLDSGGLYAPTLRRIHGKYAIACTVARLDEDAARAGGVDGDTLARFLAAEGNFVITADRLEGPWEGPFWIDGAHGIDPDLFEDADGTVYWTQTCGAPDPQVEGQGEIWTRPIDPDSWTFDAATARRVIWRGYGAEAVWTEGPHLYRTGDWVYLMAAEGGTGYDHCETIMRIHAPGPLAVALAGGGFHPDPRNPFLTHRMLGMADPVQCVGHADLLCHPTLGWWLACLGMRETPTEEGEALNFLGRETFLAPLVWEHSPQEHDASPGWPVLAGGTGRLCARIEADADGIQVERVHFTSRRTQSINIDDALTDALTVRTDPTMRYVRMTEERCIVELPYRGHVRIRQDCSHALDLVSDGAHVRWRLSDGPRTTSGGVTGVGPWQVVVGGGTACIGARAGGRPAARIDVTCLSTELAGGFVGCMAGFELPA